MNDLEYLIKQLNLLIGFLDVSDEQVFKLIKHHDRYNMDLTIEQLYDNNFDNYQNHITTSALLLGFSHFEDFLTKCVVKLLVADPEKNNFKLTFKIINEKGNDLIDFAAEEQARFLKFSEKINFIEKNLPGISTQMVTDIKYVSEIRNCLMHNNGLADKRLAPKYQIGQKIILNSGEVNGYGLQARQLAREIWNGLDLISENALEDAKKSEATKKTKSIYEELGKEEKEKEIVLKLYSKEKTAAEISDLLDIPLERVQAIVEEYLADQP